MTDNSKPRLALDLDEIERQLKMAQAGPAPKADPLAELARIVGQDDPFGQMLASGPKGSRQARAEPALDDVFVPREAQAPAHAAPQGYATPHQSYAAPHQPYAAPQAYADPRAAQARYDDDYPPRAGDFGRMVDEAAAYDYQPAGPDYGDDFQPLAQPRRSRKGLMLAGAALGAVVLAAGGVMAWKGGTVGSDGKPPVIQADASPLKVQPQNPGGLDIPNQNKQIYERGADGQTKVVNREEQPVDVRQAARVIASADAAPQPSTTASAGGLVAPSPTAGLGEPRKVRTVSIRPEPAPAPASPVAAQPVQAPVQAPAARPAPAASVQAAPTIASLAAVPEPRTTSTTPQARPPVPAQPVASPMPTPAAAPATPKAPQRVASLGDTPAAAPAPAAEPAAGGFAVQLSVGNSDEDARAAFRKLQQKHAAELGSRQPLIVKADANGRTIYRVRVATASREDAQALCSRLSASGQQCFVAKN